MLFALLLLIPTPCNGVPVYIEYNGTWGYFVPEDEFDGILKMMIEWEGRGEIINNLDLQIAGWKQVTKKVKRERDAWRIVAVAVGIIWGGIEIWNHLK